MLYIYFFLDLVYSGRILGHTTFRFYGVLLYYITRHTLFDKKGENIFAPNFECEECSLEGREEAFSFIYLDRRTLVSCQQSCQSGHGWPFFRKSWPSIFLLYLLTYLPFLAVIIPSGTTLFCELKRPSLDENQI